MRKQKGGWLVMTAKVAAVLAVGGLVGWGAWRGGVNLGIFRGAKARELVTAAIASHAAEDEKKAKALVDEAMKLAGDDVVVLRAAVDLYGDRRDNAVMPALKKLLGREDIGDEDLERAARVAVEWGRLELAPVRALEEWRGGEAGGKTEGRMVLVARWMLMRGDREEAERRLREAAIGSRGGEAELGLCEVLLSGGVEGVGEGLDRLERLIGDGERALRVRQRGAELAARVIGVERVKEKMDESRLEGFRGAFGALVARVDPEEAVDYQLGMHAMELAVEPETRQEVFGRVMEEFMPLAEGLQLRIARWLLEQGAGDRVLGIYEGNPHWGDPEEWEALRVEAMLRGQDFEGARAVMARETAGLSGLRRAVFRYRIAVGSGGDAEEVAAGRMGVLKAAAEGSSEAVREAAELAAGLGDVELAAGLYDLLGKDPEYELLAKLDLAGLREKRVEGRAGAMAVLEGLVSAWPRLEGVRNRLIQLRLLEGRAGAGDPEAALGMADEARGYVPYQVTAMVARLVSGKPGEALGLLEALGERGRERAAAMSPVVCAAVLAAGGRKEAAVKVRAAMGSKPLTVGEKALLERWMPAGL